MKKILTKICFSLMLAPFLVRADDGVLGLIGKAKDILSALFPLVASLAVFYFIWALTNYMRKAGEEKNDAKEQMLWGVIILFVMVSVWGLVAILDATIF